MSGSHNGASSANQPRSQDNVPGDAAAVAAVQERMPAHPAVSAHQSQPRASTPEGTLDPITGRPPEAAREPVGAGAQPAGQLGDLPDKPGHLATPEQCRLANGGVCWHLLQMAVRARQIAQKSEDDSVSLPCRCCFACMVAICPAGVPCMACMA